MSELGVVDPRLIRSVRVELDWYTSDPTKDYLLSPSAISALETILPAVEPGPRQRAFTLTGPYGTGKSALALFLADLVGGSDERRARATRRLSQTSKRPSVKARLLPVLVTCNPNPLKLLIGEACDSVARRLGFEACDLLTVLTEQAVADGYDGVLLVLDELGKTLEFAAREPLLGDPFILQDLAEWANRSEVPVIILGVLHQSFGGYAQGLDSVARSEWTKIQGRFSDIAFLPPEETLAQLVSDAIGGTPPKGYAWETEADEVRKLPGVWPSVLPSERFRDICRKSWPLHPLTVAALPVLMRRLGQNERSLFAFLVEQGLLIQAGRAHVPVRLCDLFEHVSEWIGHGGRNNAATRRWRLALEHLQSKPSLDKQERDVLRTIALLTALGRFAPFVATTEAISLALGEVASSSLQSLEKRRAIVHRRYQGAWALWEGSDVDLDGLLDQARAKVSGRVNLAKVLLETGAVRAGIAQRHYEQFGTLRWFQPLVLTDPDNIVLPTSNDPSNGVLALAFGATPHAQQRFESWAKEQSRPDMIVAVVHRAPAFTSMAEELAAIERVDANEAELRGDRIAREELAVQRASLTAALAKEAERLLDPSGPDGCIFFQDGENWVECRRHLARVYSDTCDSLFPWSPVLRNELINRRSLSSAAAAARRDLIQRMIEKREEPRLGYDDGYPPDRAMYESVLLQSGLHQEDADGRWAFGLPHADDPCRLGKLWQHLEVRLFDEFPEPISVDHLALELRQPPFGLVDGPFPLLLLAFLLAHEGETALYRDGAFLATHDINQWELLLRRPEMFSVAGCRQEGARKRVLELVCGRLGVEPPSLMPAVRYVIKAVDGLAPRAKVTKDVSQEAKSVRAAALEATSPEVFFFHQLPAALNIAGLTEDEDPQLAASFLEQLRAVLNELNDVVPRTRKWARLELANAAGFPKDDPGFHALRKVAEHLRHRLDDPKARELCNRLCISDADAAEVGALSLIAMRPVETWTDQDRDGFLARATALTQEIRAEAARAGNLPDRDRDTLVRSVVRAIAAKLQVDQVEDKALLLTALRRLVKIMEAEALK